MVGPVRITPTGLQPGSAESFSTYVQGQPAAKTPLAGTESIPIIQGGITVRSSPAALALALPTVRTILTANQNYYVAIGGSDSANGLSPATAWATLQHAANFISSAIDVAGFTVTVNIGAGSFVGLGLKSTIGDGNVFFLGAGSSSTAITNGPNDGVYNFGEPICFNATFDSVFYINSVKIVPNNNDAVDFFAPVLAKFFSVTSNLADVVVDLTNIGGNITFWLATAGVVVQDNGITYIGGGASVSNIWFMDNISVWTMGVAGTMSTISGNLSWSDSCLHADTGGIWESGCNGFTLTGVVTGKRFELQTGAGASSLSGSLGLNFFPGNAVGTCDNSSNYDQYPGSEVPTTFAALQVRTGATHIISDGLAANCADGSCTTWGTHVTGGGGALNLRIWYNGTSWTLVGK